LYHASKAALRVFVSGIAPIAENANPNLKIRLYRAGVIKGPLSWAPTNRLNSRAYRIRARRCNSAPEPEVVAKSIEKFIERTPHRRIGSDTEPFSFQLLKHFSWTFPNSYLKLQFYAWENASRFFFEHPKK
jgi:hypothetical protein